MSEIARKKNDSLLLEQIHKDAIEYRYDNLIIFDNKSTNKKKSHEKRHTLRENINDDSSSSRLSTYDYDYNQNLSFESMNQAFKTLSAQQKGESKNPHNLIPFYILGPTDKQMGYKIPYNFANYDNERQQRDENDDDDDDEEDEETTENESSSSSDGSNSDEEDSEEDDNGGKDNTNGRNTRRF